MVTLTGTGFDPYTMANNVVTLSGGSACTVSAATKTTITCKLAKVTTPATTPQKVKVVVNSIEDATKELAIR